MEIISLINISILVFSQSLTNLLLVVSPLIIFCILPATKSGAESYKTCDGHKYERQCSRRIDFPRKGIFLRKELIRSKWSELFPFHRKLIMVLIKYLAQLIRGKLWIAFFFEFPHTKAEEWPRGKCSIPSDITDSLMALTCLIYYLELVRFLHFLSQFCLLLAHEKFYSEIPSRRKRVLLVLELNSFSNSLGNNLT